jgi:ribosomal protein S12 methylthiotransferase
MKSICFISLGCPKNQVDSEVMLGELTEKGYILTDDPSHGQVIVVNTCAFIEDAKKESIDTILEMSKYKKSGACELLVVAGCLPQRYKDELAESLPEVDLFIGVGELDKIADLILSHGGEQSVEVGSPDYLYDHSSNRVLTGRSHAAYIKIAEGCFHGCSFCIIPQIRGKYRSRDLRSIVMEARDLISRGVKELNLIAQDTTAYGRDLKEELDLAVLLMSLSDLPGEKWIRILYGYPHNFPDSVIAALRNCDDVVKYLDIPIQHVSNRILKSMQREGGIDEIRLLLERLRYFVPGIALRTSVIVGYPGETDEEFSELLDFICEAKFDHLGAFVYSQEEGTVAAKIGDHVPRKVAEERRRVIMTMQQEISCEINARKLGMIGRVLVEGPSEETEHLLVGRHAGQAPDIDGVVYINQGTAPVGQFATVEITETHEYDLVGRII